MLTSLPSVNAFSSRAQWQRACWEHLIKQLANLTPARLDCMLTLITCAAEREIMLRRAAGLTRIIQGKSYREIGRELWLSPQLISSIKKGLRATRYASNWPRAKAQALARMQSRYRDSEKPMPKRYRRSKFGKTTAW